MKKSISLNYLTVLIVALVMLAMMPLTTYASHKLQGNAFDYTAEKIPKSNSWANQKIQYDSWAKNADIAVLLDQHLYDILLRLVQTYAVENNIDIAVKEGTCGISAGLLTSKSVDVAGFCCPAGRLDRLPGLEFHTVGVGPLAIIVHKDNPVKNITAEQARQLFSGDIKNWSELGGPDMRVVPIARLHCKARPGHWRLILDNEELFSPAMVEVGDIPAMVRVVANDIRAVGHLATWNIHKYADQWQVKALEIDGMNPNNLESLESGKYPFYRSYNITSWASRTTHDIKATALVRYLIENTYKVDDRFNMVPAARLRKAGWKFNMDELIGEPD